MAFGMKEMRKPKAGLDSKRRYRMVIVTLALAFTVAVTGDAVAQKRPCGTQDARQLNSNSNRQDCMKYQDAVKMQTSILSDQQSERRKNILRKQRALSKNRQFPQQQLLGNQRNRIRALQQQSKQRGRNQR
ncbi:MAG: hypothetical protein CMM10_16305 [Rhodospirillaceae bacterium]|jgi:hypothetical protein|nr:hypothetical protein [Rhodospirillaceae bacterium]|tara:strand:- start:626 stop:1018 length:393 start_codon:yes stop_codon:yes gene_type:complete